MARCKIPYGISDFHVITLQYYYDKNSVDEFDELIRSFCRNSNIDENDKKCYIVPRKRRYVYGI